ncbi:sodium-dependent glucose transporter 1-like [Branchiostoma floridae x Branchiostoma belcheri]
MWGLVILQHIAGWGHGFTDTAVTVLCTQLWGDRASVPLHATQAGYPLGSFAIQLIVIPFVSPDRTAFNNHTASPALRMDHSIPPPLTVDQATPPPLTVDEARLTSHIQWPYAGVAAVQFAMFVLFFYFQYSGDSGSGKLRKVRETPQSLSAFFSPGRFLKGRGGKAALLLFLLLLFYILVQAQMNSLTQYMVSYLVESGMYGKAEANVVYSSFWVCIAVMRWLSTAIAAWVPISVMLSVEIVCLSAASVAMAFWGANNRPAFWVLTCVCGLVVAPIVPGGNAWANQNLEASPVVFALCLIGAAIGGTASSSAAGYLFEHVGPRSTLYMFMGCCCALLLVFTIMQLSVSPVWDKISSRKEEGEKATEVAAGVTENLCSQSNAC